MTSKDDFQKPYIDWKKDPDPYRFDLDQKGFPVFSDKNLRLVWAMVENDSAYNSVEPKTVKDAFQEALKGNTKYIKQAVYITDKVNSTHLATLRSADMAILEANKDKKEFLDVLKGNFDDEDEDKNEDEDEDEDESKLKIGRFMTAWEIINDKVNLNRLIKAGDEQAVYRIAHYSEKYAKEQLGIEIVKNNFSFASKFCHYACVNGLEEDRLGRDRDLFPIYDSVVTQVLPYYIWVYSDKVEPSKHRQCKTKYRILEKFLEDCRNDDSPAGYQQFRGCYDNVIKGIGRWREANGQSGLNVPEIGEKGELSYRHVDRLIWYYFKGRRLDDAKEQFEELIGW